MSIRLVSFDALDTLIRVKGKTPGVQYLQSLRRHGVAIRDGIDDKHVFRNFLSS